MQPLEKGQSDGCAVLDLCAEQALVRREGCIEILDCDTQMVDPPCRHASDSIERRGVSGLG